MFFKIVGIVYSWGRRIKESTSIAYFYKGGELISYIYKINGATVITQIDRVLNNPIFK